MPNLDMPKDSTRPLSTVSSPPEFRVGVPTPVSDDDGAGDDQNGRDQQSESYDGGKGVANAPPGYTEAEQGAGQNDACGGGGVVDYEAQAKVTQTEAANAGAASFLNAPPKRGGGLAPLGGSKRGGGLAPLGGAGGVAEYSSNTADEQHSDKEAPRVEDSSLFQNQKRKHSNAADAKDTSDTVADPAMVPTANADEKAVAGLQRKAKGKKRNPLSRFAPQPQPETDEAVGVAAEHGGDNQAVGQNPSSISGDAEVELEAHSFEALMQREGSANAPAETVDVRGTGTGATTESKDAVGNDGDDS